MENLNAEQAIEILEKFDFFQGQRAGLELWTDKPFDVQEQDISNLSRDVALLKNYIKELTEENKVLSDNLAIANKSAVEIAKENERLKNICESYMLQYGTATDKEAFLKSERADTVRKMHSLIKERCIAGGIYPAFVASTIEKVEKEMLEEV